jgi:hypothetical protein
MRPLPPEYGNFLFPLRLALMVNYYSGKKVRHALTRRVSEGDPRLRVGLVRIFAAR